MEWGKEMTVQVMTRLSEENLLQTATAMMGVQMPVRCVHIPVKDITPFDAHIHPDPVQVRIIKELHKNIGSQDAMIYVCDDQDLFVLSRSITRKFLDFIIESMPPELNLRSVMKPDNIFEVHIDGQRLIKLCEQKIIEKEERKRQANASEAQRRENNRLKNKAAIDDYISLNKGLISTLGNRRRERVAPSILVIEDDLFSQKLVGNALRQKYNVVFAENGMDGFVEHVRSACDMIFLDINLPDVTGMDILQRILNIDPQAHIVMLSGNGNRENVVKAMQLGAKGFVAKPFTIEKLRQSTEKCTHLSDKQRKTELQNA